MTVWLKAIYSAQKDIICTTKINKNVTGSGWILCLTVIFVYHWWNAISRRRPGPKHSDRSSQRWWILAFGEGCCRESRLKKSFLGFARSPVKIAHTGALLCSIGSLPLVAETRSRPKLSRGVWNRSVFSQRLWHCVQFGWFRHSVPSSLLPQVVRRAVSTQQGWWRVSWMSFVTRFLLLCCLSIYHTG